MNTSQAGAVAALGLGLGLGAAAPHILGSLSPTTIAWMHIVGAVVALLIIVAGSYTHVSRLAYADTPLAWGHIAIFTVTLFFAGWAASHHWKFYLRPARTFSQDEGRVKVFVNGKCKDATGYLASHPGGAEALKRANGKDLVEQWKKSGKGFHLGNGALQIAQSLPDCE